MKGMFGETDLRKFALVCIAAALGLSARADTVVITVNTTIDSTNAASYAGKDVIVRGCTVTLNGAHSWASLTIERSAGNVAGALTHTKGIESSGVKGFFLTLSGNLFVQGPTGGNASRIDVSSMGYAASEGPGQGTDGESVASGAAHIGNGGRNHTSFPAGVPGASYDSFLNPTDFGSGGGTDGAILGGSGGGYVRIEAAGTATIDGSLLANGGNRTAGEAGGGAGGTIILKADTVTGAGLVSANGGQGNVTWSGGGGGGAIVLDYESYSQTLTVAAVGGTGYQGGGAGSIVMKEALFGISSVSYSNGGLSGAWTEWGPTDYMGTVFVESGAVLSPPRGTTPVWTVTGEIWVSSGAAIRADGMGHGADMGPGAGASGPNIAQGASFGGRGGRSHPTFGVNTAAACYGQFKEPDELGSGGGSDESSLGGAGGGAIHLIVDGQITVNGQVTSHGLSRVASEAGGGSGGSIWIESGLILGSGTIAANGGDGNNSWSGAGGGGRIALYSQGLSPDLVLQSKGGSGYEKGGAGTIYFKSLNASSEQLLVDNSGVVGATTDLVSFTLNGLMQIKGSAVVSPGYLSNPTWSLTGPLLLDADGTISATGMGYAASEGPGAGGDGPTIASGASHGGRGGASHASNSWMPPGDCYGDPLEPVTHGSGGGSDENAGGAGGGAIKIVCTGSLVADGVVASDGMPRAAGEAGGGAGGSIWLDVALLEGSGTIRANGGGGNTSWSGSGAGGRIAVYYSSNIFAGTIQAVGANGFQRGGAGSVFLRDTNEARGILKYSNGGSTGATTDLPSGSYDCDVEVDGNAILAPKKLEQTHWTFTGGMKIHPAGSVSGLGRGHESNQGEGPGSTGSTIASGAGYGGRGGKAHPSGGQLLPGGIYGSVQQPTDFGSGGGADDQTLGGAGGGALRITLGGNLQVNGNLDVNGGARGGTEAGGGSGGSLWIEAPTMMGSGSINAKGGSGNTQWSGGGGGGRIAIYANTSSYLGTVSAAGGTGYEMGCPGSIYYHGTNPGLQGQVTFEDLAGNAPDSVLIGYGTPGTDCLTFEQRVPLNPDGTFTATAPSPEVWDVRLKAGSWLAKRTTVNFSSGSVTGFSQHLPHGGDADDDNAVTLLDYDLFSAAFDSVDGDANYSEWADFDRDGFVTLLDYDVFSKNFDLVGDE